MPKQYEKFLETIDEKIRKHFFKALRAMDQNKFEGFDMKRLAGYDNLYRIRIGKWRIVFCREMGGNKVLKIESRGDAYKGL